MDNFRLDVRSEGDKALRLVFDLLALSHISATHFQVTEREGVPTLVFFWANPNDKDVTAFPFKADAEAMTDFAKRWLAEAEYPPEPDHDGHNGKGFRVFNEAWGHVFERWQAFAAVQPMWAMYGK